MAITGKSIKLLWSNAAGRCSFTDCNEKLSVEQAAHLAPYTIGEMAHIKGKHLGSNRYDAEQIDKQRDGYENLILLCPNHHTLIDKPENEQKYTVEVLLNMKKAHESYISHVTENEKIANIDDLKNAIAMLLAQNYQTWKQYGPLSENARKEPHSDELHAIWLRERLATIVPNNRVIEKLIICNKNLFSRKYYPVITRFLSHVKSYECWVNDEIPYKAVMRFPTDFEAFIFEE
ncbi:HNH endonuclease signature motif containing protein [Photorhabdus luminescens]|uniref:HNH endonuclease n=1 Tax=Photorhabdus luminescens subsp. sonorensis TaxID=1173677 RepID=A0A5C4RLE9_PHOLU|nr:HNH endonuclease signature motif containing protein [Photorhabdus luminescens]TNH44541.1 HNH endonuclease [Photorhabdus luminescens subsp. sonorensis]